MIKTEEGYFQLPKFVRREILHGFSPKSFGNMSYLYGSEAEVNVNRKRFAEAVLIDTNAVAQMDLAHSATVAVVRKENIGSLYIGDKAAKGVDSLVTNYPGVALWVLTGDCAPILFFDPIKGVIGLAHSGWQGTVGQIASKTVLTMVEKFGSGPEDILVGIGPAIEKCCYLEPRPVAQENLPEWQPYLSPERDRMRVDLNGFTIATLEKAGILPQHIDYANYCTKDHSNDFFSSKLEKIAQEKSGRFATVIQLI